LGTLLPILGLAGFRSGLNVATRTASSLTGPLFRDQWNFLMRGVSLKTVLLAFVPVAVWILFLVFFVSAYRAVIHVHGTAGMILRILRSLVEIVTVIIALRYFFEILRRGAASDFSIHSQDRSSSG
jgi:hypothetical protein